MTVTNSKMVRNSTWFKYDSERERVLVSLTKKHIPYGSGKIGKGLEDVVHEKLMKMVNV
jgi:hypothetical protein